MTEKKYISAQTLLDDSLQLALKIAESGFKPDLIVGVWRGGTPVAISIQEVLEFIGCQCDHIAIRTISYTGIAQRSEVQVHGLDYIKNNLSKENKLLIVDDVFDTGLSLDQVINDLSDIYKDNLPEIKIATPYFKPTNNKTQRNPDFYLHETEQWLVFPHEIIGLSDAEILSEKPGLDTVKQKLIELRSS